MDTHLIVQHFNKLAIFYKMAGDAHRSATFSRVSKALTDNGIEFITSGKDIAHIAGIGASSVSEVDELLTLARAGKDQNTDRLGKLILKTSSLLDGQDSAISVEGAFKTSNITGASTDNATDTALSKLKALRSQAR